MIFCRLILQGEYKVIEQYLVFKVFLRVAVAEIELLVSDKIGEHVRLYSTSLMS